MISLGTGPVAPSTTCAGTRPSARGWAEAASQSAVVVLWSAFLSIHGRAQLQRSFWRESKREAVEPRSLVQNKKDEHSELVFSLRILYPLKSGLERFHSFAVVEAARGAAGGAGVAAP